MSDIEKYKKYFTKQSVTILPGRNGLNRGMNTAYGISRFWTEGCMNS